MHYIQRNMLLLIVLCVTILGITAASRISNESLTKPTIAVDSNTSLVDQGNADRDNSSGIYTGNDISAPTEASKVVQPQVMINKDGISALAYIAANVETGEIYVERNSSEVLPVASMSKLVTAFAATDILAASTSITISKFAADVPPDGSGIREGETYTLDEILYPLLLDSSNIAAEALSSSTTKRSKFLELMSSYAWEIGMSSAYFADPSGVSSHNAASAFDLLALAKYLYKFRPDILALTRTYMYEVSTTTEHDSHTFVSTHPFVNDVNFIGGKTGRTPEAGDTMLTIMNVGGNPVAIIVLGSNYNTRAIDTRKILDTVTRMIKTQ
ncbi:MAG: serine hydrolase [Candidatus Taylorbacteria bacterium]